MKFRFVHLYPQAMSLYGEYANLVVVRRMLEALGHEVEVDTTVPPTYEGAHLIYMGCGTERSQKSVLMALQQQVDGLKAALEKGAVVLFTGNAMDTLGQTVTDARGQVWQGMGLAPFDTVETNSRTPHDVIATSTLWDVPAVGFMNKCSTTCGVDTPLFSSLTMGFGNDTKGGAEGYVSGNLFATHITGPVLVKNPAFAQLIVKRLLESVGEQVPETLPTLPHQQEAYDVTLTELSKEGEGAK